MAQFLIVVPTFNSGTYLEGALASLAIQDGNFDLHVHVQDGGSTDNTLDVASAWQARFSGRKKLSFISEPDSGIYDAVSRGAARLHPDQIMTWLGSDDLLMPGALATVASIFGQLPQVEWLTGLPFIGVETGESLTPWPARQITRMGLSAGHYDGRTFGCIMQEGTFWRASLWQKAGGLDTRYRLAGDWDLWRRFALHSPLYTLNFPLARFTIRNGRTSEDMASYYKEVDESDPMPLIDDSSAYELTRYPPLQEWQVNRRVCE